MVENYALYVVRYDSLPHDEMTELVAGVLPNVSRTDRGRTFTFEWPDLTIVCSEMPQGEMQKHLNGFESYILQVYGGACDSRGEKLVERVRQTKLVVGVEIQPERDDSGRAEELLGSLCSGLVPLVFFEDAIYDSNSLLLLGPDGTYDDDAVIDE